METTSAAFSRPRSKGWPLDGGQLRRSIVGAITMAVLLSLPGAASGQAKIYPLTSADGLRLQDVVVAPGTLQGKSGVRVTISDDAERRLKASANARLDELAVIDGVDFSSGVIEVDIAGAPLPGAQEGARGFVGIAFRVQKDLQTYDAFFLRPTNGRADDQERRNHSAQYVSHPAWPWFRLRQETPSKYEAYVDVVPATWTKIKIDVRGAQARFYVHDQPQPTLVVNDVKSGPQARGAIALWIGQGTVAHFRQLTVKSTPAATR